MTSYWRGCEEREGIKDGIKEDWWHHIEGNGRREEEREGIKDGINVMTSYWRGYEEREGERRREKEREGIKEEKNKTEKRKKVRDKEN